MDPEYLANEQRYTIVEVAAPPATNNPDGSSGVAFALVKSRDGSQTIPLVIYYHDADGLQGSMVKVLTEAEGPVADQIPLTLLRGIQPRVSLLGGGDFLAVPWRDRAWRHYGGDSVYNRIVELPYEQLTVRNPDDETEGVGSVDTSMVWSGDVTFSDPTGVPVGLTTWDSGGYKQQILLTIGMTTATLSRQRVEELLPFLERFVRTGDLLES